MQKLIPILIFILILSSPCSATDYYFSNTGDDSNPGTEVSPKETMAEVNTVLGAGHSVFFNKGDTWTIAENGEGINIDFNSTSGSPTVIGAYGTGALPIITAFANTGDGTRGNGSTDVCIYIGGSSGDYITIEYLDIRAATDEEAIDGYNSYGPREYLTVQNCTLSTAGFVGEGIINIHGDHISILNNYLDNSAEASFSTGIEISDANYTIIRGNRLDNCIGQGGGIRLVHMDRALVEDNWINGANNNAPTASGGETHWAIVPRNPYNNSLPGGDYNIIRNNVIDLSNTIESDCTGNDDCNFGLNTWNADGAQVYSDVALLIYNNTFISNGYGSGLKVQADGDPTITQVGEIRNNIFYNFDVAIEVDDSIENTGDFVASNNNYYSCSSYIEAESPGTQITDSGSSQNTDPLLVLVPTLADTDFALQSASSPCYRAGVTGTYIPTVDYAGNSWSPPSIGAYSTTEAEINPVITITSPTSNATYATSSSTINISGTGSIASGTVDSVTWVNDRGGSGSCTGTTSWSVTGITLYSGVNVITITGTSDLAATGTAIITVTYTPQASSGETVGSCDLKSADIK